MPTLNTVLDRVQQRAQALQPVDVQRRLDQYQYEFSGNAVSMKSFGAEAPPLLLHDHALRQLCSRLKVPYDYLKRCPNPLAWSNLNFWAQDGAHNKESLIRTIQGNQVRAIVSDAYTAFDDVDILPIVADVLDGEVVVVQNMDFANDYTHIRIVFPRENIEVRPGDIVQTGLHLSNSEVGLRAVHIDALIYRLICKNGAVSSESASRTSIRHIGRPERLKDFVRQAVADARMGTQVLAQAFKSSVHEKVSDPHKLIERVSGDGHLSQEQFKRVLASFATEGADATLYGCVNAFTHAAQSEPTFEARYALEKLGTQLLLRR